MSKSRLYILTSVLLLAGYIYLGYSIHYYADLFTGHTLCMFKTVTGIPCPSCGSTRAIACLLQGDVVAAMYWNPFGFILLLGLIVLPALIIYDLVTSQNTYYTFYQRTEAFFRQKPVMIIAIVLVVANWIWNINKGL